MEQSTQIIRTAFEQWEEGLITTSEMMDCIFANEQSSSEIINWMIDLRDKMQKKERKEYLSFLADKLSEAEKKGTSEFVGLLYAWQSLFPT